MKLNSILGKYITRQLIFNFLAVLFMVLGIVFLFEMIERMRRLATNPDFGMLFILQMTIARLPKTIEQVFPFVIMIAAMICFWRLGKTSEYVVMRSAGISAWQFLTPICTVTLIIGIINITLVNPIAAKLNEIYETMEHRVDIKDPKALMYSEQGLWIREAISPNTVMVMQAKKLQHENDGLLLRGVSIIEMDKKAQPIRQIETFAGVLKDGYFNLKDVKIYTTGQPIVKLNEMNYKTILDINKIEDSFAEPEAISFLTLPSVIHFYEKSGFAVQRLQMRFWSLFISPIFLVCMIILAAVFALRPSHRRGGIIFLIVGGVIAGFSTFFMSQLVYAMGSSGNLPVLLAVIAPTLIVGSISTYTLLRLEDE